MVTTLAETNRIARKQYHCSLCGTKINPGDLHHVQTNVYDGRVYDWRDCLPCDSDHVLTYVHDWTGGYEEGVGYEQAVEWAQEAIGWPQHWLAHNRPITGAERTAARAWLARAAGGEGE